MTERPDSLWARLPLILGNGCIVGLLILAISMILIRQTQAGPASNAGFVFMVTAVFLGPLGIVTMLTGWRRLLRDGAAKYGWYALAVGAFSCAIGLNFGLRLF